MIHVFTLHPCHMSIQKKLLTLQQNICMSNMGNFQLLHRKVVAREYVVDLSIPWWLDVNMGKKI